MMPSNKAVHFSERVTVASLPVEEYKDSLNARRGPWGSAPICDELWDGERRIFWERELAPDELREILRFRRLAKYALVLQSNLNFVKVPMPKIPTIIEELVHLGQLERARRIEESSPRMEEFRKAIAFPVDPVSRDSSPVIHAPPPQNDVDSPLPTMQKTANVSAVDLFKRREEEEEFSFENPSINPDANAHAGRKHGSGVLSPSQRASMRGASRVIKDVVHRGRSKQRRMRKRAQTHAVLQPWFALLYFLLPISLLAIVYLMPFFLDVFLAWKNERVIRAAIEVPALLLRVLPDNAYLKGTISFGLFAFEATGVLYLAILFASQLAVFVVIRPLVMTLSTGLRDLDLKED